MTTALAAPAQAADRLDLTALPRVLPRLLRMAWRYPGLCLSAVACAAGSAVLNVLTPQCLGHAVDEALALARTPGAPTAALAVTAALLVALCVLRGLVTGGMGYLGEGVAQRVGRDLRLAYFERLQRLDAAFHDRHHSGDLIARGLLDLEGVRGFVELGLLRIVLLLLLVGFGLWRLLHVDPVLAALALSFVPVVAWRAARMGVRLRLTWTRLQALMGELARAMEENLQGVRVVRAFGAQAHELTRFDTLSDRALAMSNARITHRMRAISQMVTLYHVAMGAVLWLGTHRIAAGTLSVGELTEVLTFMTLLQMPVRQVGMVVNASARAVSSGQRLFEVLDREPALVDAPGALALVRPRGELRVEQVDFAYGTRTVLHGIDFSLSPGRTLGLVGPPGSGKSTLVQLLARLRDVDAGRITLDGHDLRSLTLDSVRRAVAVVQQEVFLFDISVHDNAAYARVDAPAGEVTQALADAQLLEHVRGLPEGTATRVGERGVALSGGQRQRLAIARSLVADAAVVVFDDATSAVDTATETALRRALRGAVADKAVIIVSHRLGSVRDADEILVLDRGRIVERGRHEDLVARHGSYARLWALQKLSSQPGSTPHGPHLEDPTP